MYEYECINAKDKALDCASETFYGIVRNVLNKLELVFNLGIDISSNVVNIV